MVSWNRIKWDIILIFTTLAVFVIWHTVFVPKVFVLMLDHGFIGIADATASPIKTQALFVIRLIGYGILFLAILPILDMIISVFKTEGEERYT